MSEARKELKVFDAGICKFGIQNCYDIEFAGSHYLTQAGAEVILVPSCTETIRGATREYVEHVPEPWNFTTQLWHKLSL